MRKQRTSPAISYLFELTIALFFFAISSIIIITLFAHAQMKQVNSIDTNNAVLIAQSIVANLKNDTSPKMDGNQVYNEQIQPHGEGMYLAKWSIETTDTILIGTLEIWKAEELVLSYPFALEQKEDVT